MADHGTAIEWTHGEGYRGETWNPVTGCSKVSPGCAHCYAEALSLRYGWSKKPWTPENAEANVVLHPERLKVPLGWKEPRMVFVNSMSDMFHELIPYEFIREVFNVMRRCDGGVIAATGKRDPSHVFQVLTKRPEVALALWRERKLGFVDWPADVWLGVSIENSRYTWRADVLREIPATVRFISAEPLLGSLIETQGEEGIATAERGSDAPQASNSVNDTYPPRRAPLNLTGIDWVIVGGESGPGARPMDPKWAREIRDACAPQCCGLWRTGCCGYYLSTGECCGEGVQECCDEPEQGPAFFFKQWGGPTPKSGGKLLDGREWCEMPRARPA